MSVLVLDFQFTPLFIHTKECPLLAQSRHSTPTRIWSIDNKWIKRIGINKRRRGKLWSHTQSADRKRTLMQTKHTELAEMMHRLDDLVKKCVGGETRIEDCPVMRILENGAEEEL